MKNRFAISISRKYLAMFLILLFGETFGQTNESPLVISPLTGDFYVYTTYNLYQGYRIPANGLLVNTSSGVVMIDTPWDTTQFAPLLDSIDARFHKKVVLCLATHWHEDRTGGLEFYAQMGIPTYTSVLTDELSKTNNKKRAEYHFLNDTTFNVGQYNLETYYPGPGHTRDNIVLWIPTENILYGGCLIKGAKALDLGNLADADEKAYAQTLINVRDKYSDPHYIIVSHSDWKSTKSLKHSIKLAKKLKSR